MPDLLVGDELPLLIVGVAVGGVPFSCLVRRRLHLDHPGACLLQEDGEAPVIAGGTPLGLGGGVGVDGPVPGGVVGGEGLAVEDGDGAEAVPSLRLVRGRFELDLQGEASVSGLLAPLPGGDDRLGVIPDQHRAALPAVPSRIIDPGGPDGGEDAVSGPAEGGLAGEVADPSEAGKPATLLRREVEPLSGGGYQIEGIHQGDLHPRRASGVAEEGVYILNLADLHRVLRLDPEAVGGGGGQKKAQESHGDDDIPFHRITPQAKAAFFHIKVSICNKYSYEISNGLREPILEG